MQSMITVSKTTKLCIAHRLMFHKGKCKNLHGHNYKVTATFCAESFSTEEGMVIDFGTVKNTVFKMLDDAYDHTTFLYDKDPLADVLESNGVRVAPAAEELDFRADDIVFGIDIVLVAVLVAVGPFIANGRPRQDFGFGVLFFRADAEADTGFRQDGQGKGLGQGKSRAGQ